VTNTVGLLAATIVILHGSSDHHQCAICTIARRLYPKGEVNNG
jgi:hypothetical protein